MKRGRRSGVTLLTGLTIAVAIAVALCATGVMRGGTANSAPTFTTKVMVAALRANEYPVTHPKKLTCRGLGTAVNGRHAAFRCVATLKAQRERHFYARTIAKGGWLCAGKTGTSCKMLPRGFFPTSAADNAGWQEIAVLGWLQAHHIDVNGAVGLTCTGLKSPITCTLNKKPSITVVLAYQKADPEGYVETATRLPAR